MAISEGRKQKRLQEKKRKRKLLAKPARAALAPRQKALVYAKYPVHEGLVPVGLFAEGLGTVIGARRPPHGRIGLSAFIVDVFCLGVKNALFHVSSEQEYEKMAKPGLLLSREGRAFHSMDPACTRRLIEGAADYAERLGFQPHPDYRNAKGIFGDVDAADCRMTFTYGHEGKPFYIRGPNESTLQAKGIVEQLERRCGEGGFDFLVGLD